MSAGRKRRGYPDPARPKSIDRRERDALEAARAASAEFIRFIDCDSAEGAQRSSAICLLDRIVESAADIHSHDHCDEQPIVRHLQHSQLRHQLRAIR
mgnify:CR=1 FL=1